MKVALCVTTFRRPVGLKRLLQALAGQVFDEVRPELEFVIVDNDEGRSAQAVCEAMKGAFPWPIRYEPEPRRGISPARNRAVACGMGFADFIAFIDDDEVPEPTWLAELLGVQQLYDADVVTGPILPIFPDGAADWIRKGRFFASPRYATGQLRDVAYTGNVLIRSDVFRRMDDHFDERLALSGGEDSQFFRRVRRAGFSIVWADDAVAHEYIPTSRACLSWLVARFYRIGNARGVIALLEGHPLRTRLVLLAKTGFWGLAGILLTPVGVVAGRHVSVKGIRYLAYALGTLSSVFGGRYEEYRTTHGK